jgi:gamma-glutamyltranspeptidase/glutathione hydrolase
MIDRLARCRTALSCLAILLLLVSGLPGWAAHHPPHRSRKGMVAADNETASRVGAEILAAGGNAVDAAAATALALGVVHPQGSGIGGGGFAVIYLAKERKTYVLDFREVGPRAITPQHFVVDGKVNPALAQTGGLAVAVPGEVAGLEHMVRKFGRRPFRTAVVPAEKLARNGFPASHLMAEAARRLHEKKETLADPGLLAWLVPGGAPVEAGQKLRRPVLAATLARIAREGARGFYSGPVARDIVAAVQRSGGVLTLDDLAAYRVVERTPLTGTWGQRRLVTMPLPSSGGLVLLEALGILTASRIELGKLGAGSSAALHVIAELLKHGFADRARLLGDSRLAENAASALLAPQRLARLASRIRPGVIGHHDSYGELLPQTRAEPARGGGTSHLCVIDGEGNAVALTTTINGWFGAQLVAPKSGVVLNDQIDDFSLAAGVPNQFGLVQSEANLVAAGKRPLSSMTPTLVFEEERVVACLGGSGGPRIISGVFQVLLNLFVFALDVRQAVEAPRIHHQWLPDELLVEPEVPRDVISGLRRRGHAVVENWRSSTAVQAIVVGPDGWLEGASDPRKTGAPAPVQ